MRTTPTDQTATNNTPTTPVHIIRRSAQCRRDHLLLHAVMEHNPAWRRLPRDQATDLIIAWLRAGKERTDD